MAEAITWAGRIANLTKALGRDPTVDEALDLSRIHEMTTIETIKQSAEGGGSMTARCEHGELDFEQCPKCRGWDAP